MAETMKDFPTAVAMSVITGVLVHERFSEVHECMTYMAGEAVWTHQLPRISREAQAWAAVARPDLAPAIDEAETIKNTDIARHLALPPVKIHCSILAEDAIKAAVADYRKKQGA